MMKKIILTAMMMACSLSLAFAQISINTTGNEPDASAMLDISSTEKGILIPRLRSSQRDSMSSPAEGLLIYNTTDDVFNYFDNGAWHELLIESEDSDQQELSVSGDSLLISGGNGIALQALEQALLQTDTTCDTYLIASQVASNANTLTNNQWQSWTATFTGTLSAFEWRASSVPILGQTYSFEAGYARIYQGEGTGGALLGEVSLGEADDNSWNIIHIDSLNIVVQADSIYTVELEENNNGFGWPTDTNDPYSGGIGNNSVNTDHQFKVYLDSCYTTSILTQNSSNAWNYNFVDSMLFTDGTIQTTASTDNQTLSISNDSLFISNGNGVDLQAVAETLYSSGTACDTKTMVSQEVGLGAAVSVDMWQSWTATYGAILKAVDYETNRSRGVDKGYAKIYAGEGTDGSLLGTVSIDSANDGWNTIDFSALNIPLHADSVYTFQLQDLNSSFAWMMTGPPIYSGGRASFDWYNDFVFRIHVDSCYNDNSFTIDGSLGIGISPSKGKLEIDATRADLPAIYASGSMVASEYITPSDARIKHIQGISNPKVDLETLLELEVTDYRLIDSLKYGQKSVKKIIAQQVAEVYPQAVQTRLTEVIPNIYQSAKMKQGWIYLPLDLQVGDKVRLMFEHEDQVVSIQEISAQGFRVNLAYEGKVFVYGKEVYDFHAVDYQALTTLNISATQAQQKLIELQQAQIELLQKQIESQQAELSLLKSKMGSNGK